MSPIQSIENHHSRQGKDAPAYAQTRENLFFIPVTPKPEWLEMCLSGELTHKEYLLLQLIHGYTLYGQGFWASKVAVAAKFDVTPRQVQRLIARLTELNLVTTVGGVETHGGRTRILATVGTEVGGRRGSSPLNKKPGETWDVSLIEEPSLRSGSSEINKNSPYQGSAEGIRPSATPVPLPPEPEEIVMSAQDKPRKTSPTDALVSPQLITGAKVDAATRFARRLHVIVTERHKVRRAWSQKEWSATLRKLIRQCDGDEGQVHDVLSYLENNWQDWTVVMSATSFVKYFDVIQGKLRRSKPSRKAEHAITDKTSRLLAEEVKEMGWPKGAAVSLDTVVDESYAAMKKLNVAILAVKKDHEDENVRRIAEDLRSDIGADPAEATVRWFRRVRDKVANWEGWSGSFKPYSVSVDSSIFTEHLNRNCVGWIGNVQASKLADKVTEAIEARL